jgi:DNA-directed RNA polymerase specialized sigma24 family protein
MDVRPGRDEALSRLFEAHYADTVRLAFYLTGSWTVGEDLAQEAFVRLWRRWGGLRDHHAALGYLRTTVVNLSRSALRRRLLELRHQRAVGEVGHDTDPVARLDVARALAALPARKRALCGPAAPGRPVGGGDRRGSWHLDRQRQEPDPQGPAAAGGGAVGP